LFYPPNRDSAVALIKSFIVIVNVAILVVAHSTFSHLLTAERSNKRLEHFQLSFDFIPQVLLLSSL
jgi:hypothetical protein